MKSVFDLTSLFVYSYDLSYFLTCTRLTQSFSSIEFWKFTSLFLSVSLSVIYCFMSSQASVMRNREGISLSHPHQKNIEVSKNLSGLRSMVYGADQPHAW